MEIALEETIVFWLNASKTKSNAQLLVNYIILRAKKQTM